MGQVILQDKLLAHFKGRKKRKELDLSLQMLRDGCGESKLIDVIDFFNDNPGIKNPSSYYTYSKVIRYHCVFEKNLKIYNEYGLDDISKIYHFVTFENNETLTLPFDYNEFYRTLEIENIWTDKIFPNIKFGEIYKTISPICYLTHSFNDLIIQGIQSIVWCEEIPEGTFIIPYEKVKIENLHFTKVMYEGKFYWLFGCIAQEDFLDGFNPHYI